MVGSHDAVHARRGRPQGPRRLRPRRRPRLLRRHSRCSRRRCSRAHGRRRARAAGDRGRAPPALRGREGRGRARRKAARAKIGCAFSPRAARATPCLTTCGNAPRPELAGRLIKDECRKGVVASAARRRRRRRRRCRRRRRSTPTALVLSFREEHLSSARRRRAAASRRLQVGANLRTDACGAAGLVCAAAFDDTDDSGCPPAAALACDRPLNTKVCECVWRRCDGDGDCTAGAALPRRSVPARSQRGPRSYQARRRVSARVGRRAAQAAADAKAHCELLGREVLTPADAARGVHEVQRLTFGVPAGGRVVGPTAHIKARAPDAPGNGCACARVLGTPRRLRRRRRRLPYVHLTVKIYPGGPPQTRGTSAHLGALAVGSTLHVPETRALRWALAPAEAVSVGMVAFGVGIAECLEPAEMILAASERARHARVRQPSRITDPVPRAAERAPRRPPAPLRPSPRDLARRRADRCRRARRPPSAWSDGRAAESTPPSSPRSLGAGRRMRRISSSSAPARWNATRGPGLQSRSAGRRGTCCRARGGGRSYNRHECHEVWHEYVMYRVM